MSQTLSQYIAGVRERHDQTLANNMQRIVPFLEHDYQRRLKAETDAKQIEYERMGAEAKLKDYGITPDWSTVPIIPGAYDSHANTLIQKAGLGATAKVEEIPLPEGGNFFEQTATVKKAIEDKDNAKDFTKRSSALGVVGKARYDELVSANPDMDPETAIAEATRYKSLYDSAGLLGKKALNKFVQDAKTSDPTTAYAEVHKIYGVTTGGGKTVQSEPSATEKKFKAIGLQPDMVNDFVYYKDGTAIKYIPVVYDGEKWVFEEGGAAVNPNYKWLKKPGSSTTTLKGITPGLRSGGKFVNAEMTYQVPRSKQEAVNSGGSTPKPDGVEMVWDASKHKLVPKI